MYQVDDTLQAQGKNPEYRSIHTNLTCVIDLVFSRTIDFTWQLDWCMVSYSNSIRVCTCDSGAVGSGPVLPGAGTSLHVVPQDGGSPVARWRLPAEDARVSVHLAGSRLCGRPGHRVQGLGRDGLGQFLPLPDTDGVFRGHPKRRTRCRLRGATRRGGCPGWCLPSATPCGRPRASPPCTWWRHIRRCWREGSTTATRSRWIPVHSSSYAVRWVYLDDGKVWSLVRSMVKDKNLQQNLKALGFAVLHLVPYFSTSEILRYCYCYHNYRLGTVNSKSFVGQVLLWIKWKFELQNNFVIQI